MYLHSGKPDCSCDRSYGHVRLVGFADRAVSYGVRPGEFVRSVLEMLEVVCSFHLEVRLRSAMARALMATMSAAAETIIVRASMRVPRFGGYDGEGGPEILRLSRGLLCQSLRLLRLAVCQRMTAVIRLIAAVRSPMISTGSSLLLGYLPNKISVT